MGHGYSSKIGVFLILKRVIDGKEEVLLQKRVNTGYMDNMYEVACSGHLEQGESLTEAIAREALEELGIVVKEEDLELLNVFHSYEEEYIRFFFMPSKYVGIPEIKEKDKCDDLRWFSIDGLPENMMMGLKETFYNIKHGNIYDDCSFSRYKTSISKEK